jgi:hypothetical protein
MGNLLNNKAVRIIGLVGICILLIIIYCTARTIIFENDQAKINLSPMQAVEALKTAGYIVEDLRETTEHIGPLGTPIYEIQFNLFYQTSSYNLLLVQYDDWEKAKMGAKVTNELDDRMGHTNYNAIYYGTILIAIDPSNVELGQRLLDILKRIQ